MKKFLLLLCMLAIMPAFAACGSSSSNNVEPDSGPTFTSVSSLPNATGAMGAPAASISASITRELIEAPIKEATSGQNLLTTTAENNMWAYGKSRGSCETFNQIKNSIRGAGQVDMTLCFVKQMDAAEKLGKDSNDNDINVYDTNWHILNLNLVDEYGAPAQDVPDKIKMRIVTTKGAAGVAGDPIESFEMFMCKEGSQMGYNWQSVSGTTLDITAVNYFSSINPDTQQVMTGRDKIVVNGKMNADKLYTEKTVIVNNTNEQEDGSYHKQSGTFIQTLHGFDFDGFESGRYVDPGTGLYSFYNNQAAANGQMLGDSAEDDIEAMAMGDGAVHFNSYGTGPNGQEYGTNYGSEPICVSGAYTENCNLDSWTGDDVAVVTSNDYTTLVASSNPPQVSDVTIEFTEAQTWTDCEGEAVSLKPTLKDQIESACRVFSMDSNWINCYDTTQPPSPTPTENLTGTYTITNSGCPDGTPTEAQLSDDDAGIAAGDAGEVTTVTVTYSGGYTQCTMSFNIGGTPITCNSCEMSSSSAPFSATCNEVIEGCEVTFTKN